MAKIIAGPSRYIQGRGELSNLGAHAQKLGRKLFIIASASGRKRVEDIIEKSLESSECTAHYELFHGECCQSEIDRMAQNFRGCGCDIVVGIGGGKAQDTAKAVAFYVAAPVIIIPTIASTDAPCSAVSVLYNEDDGLFDRSISYPSNPNIVLVDTDIISAAPTRLFVAGMGDALATYFETRACRRSDGSNSLGGKTTLSAMNLSKLCYDTLLEDGLRALLAVKAKVCTSAVENIIEANTYMSGVGFEGGGLAGAHALSNALTLISETHACYHGEKVAFGVLMQLVLENAPMEEISEVLDFCIAVGLPTTLHDLNIKNPDPEQIMEVSRYACFREDLIRNMPFAVTPDTVYAAIIGADSLGTYYKG